MDNLGTITRSDAYPNSASNNPTQDVLTNFKSQVASQRAVSPISNPPVQPSQTSPQPTTQPTAQLTQDSQSTQTNSPSPLQDLQTIDLKNADVLSGLNSGNPPQTIDIAHLNQYLTLSNLGKLGSQGDVVTGEIPKGYDPKQNVNGFIAGQCTSYASWYMTNVLGKKFVDTRPGNGDAKNWATLAQDQGFSVTDTPQTGSVVVWPTMGEHGHVAIVQGVNNDGTINVSEMNYQPNKFTARNNVSTSGAQFISK